MNRENWASNLFLFGLAVMAISLPFSEFGMSQAQFILAGAWLLRGKYVHDLKKVFRHPIALGLIVLYFIHVVFLVNTSDFAYAFKDLRIKLPLLLLPLFIFSFELPSKKTLHLFSLLFIAAVFVASIIASIKLNMGNSGGDFNSRDASVFISHIRFSLMVCMSIVLLFHFWKNDELHSLLAWIFIVWFFIFLILLQSLTGIIILLAWGLATLIYSMSRLNKKGVIVFTFVGAAFIFIYAFQLYRSVFIYAPAVPGEATYTPTGNRYEHTDLKDCENGQPVFQFLCHQELAEIWLRKNNFDSTYLSDQHYITLLRYMTSKGLKKDSTSFKQLLESDLKNIRDGIPNFQYVEMFPIHKRLYETTWELYMYRLYNRAGGHSFTQRFEYWSTGLKILKNNFFFGVGTGDIALAYTEQYNTDKSFLKEKYRLRSHNQYLSFAIAFGIIGFIVAMIFLIRPLFMIEYQKAIYLSFMLIGLLSFVNEDTLETQAGVSFFAFFYCFSALLAKIYK